MKRTCGRNPHADSALFAARRTPGRFACVVQLCEHGAGIVEEGATGLGQLDTTPFAAEELRVKLAFQRLDLLTEGWLLHAQPLRGARDVPFLGDCNEIPEVPEFHLISIRYEFCSDGIMDRLSRKCYPVLSVLALMQFQRETSDET